MDDATISLLVLGVVVVLFVANRLPVGVVAIGTALALWATGLLSLPEAFAGFGDPVVIFIAALFVVSEGVSATGISTWAGQRVTERVGSDPTRLVVVVMLMCAVVTALISLNGAVAALLPMVVVLALRSGVAPSRMLMPLAFAGSAGSLLVLTGTPINVIVADASVEAGGAGFGFFEFGLVGVPLVAGTVAIVVALGPRLLPRRAPPAATVDLSGYARTLVEQYGLRDGVFRLRVRARSPYLGEDPRRLAVERFEGVRLVTATSPDGRPLTGDNTVAENDVLVVRGQTQAVNRLVLEKVLAVAADTGDLADDLLGREVGVAEVVVPPRSRLVGETVHPGMARRGDQVILAVQRRGRDQGAGDTVLAVGDTMLVQGTWEALEQNVDNPDVLVVDSPDLVRRQVGPPGPRAVRAVVVLGAMVALLALGVVPAVVAALLAAVAMVLLRVISSEQAYRAVPWSTIVLIGGLIPLAAAIENSGAADLLAAALLAVVGGGGPYALMLGLFVLAGALGQFVSNTATALILIPVAIAAAADLGVSVQPVLMLLAVATAASFLTPIATAANLMVMRPGAYEFGDYWKLGLPIMLWFMVVAVLLVPVIWPFS